VRQVARRIGWSQYFFVFENGFAFQKIVKESFQRCTSDLDRGHECLLEALVSSQKMTDYSGLSALFTVKWKRK